MVNDEFVTHYYPHVVYAYSAGGESYMSDQVAIGTPRGYGSMTEAESRLVYQADKPVTVYYDPKSPADAVLEPGATGGVWGTFFIAAGLLGVGLLVLISSVRSVF